MINVSFVFSKSVIVELPTESTYVRLAVNFKITAREQSKHIKGLVILLSSIKGIYNVSHRNINRTKCLGKESTAHFLI